MGPDKKWKIPFCVVKFAAVYVYCLATMFVDEARDVWRERRARKQTGRLPGPDKET